jgi:SAM dependent carboxyl methyltransferase
MQRAARSVAIEGSNQPFVIADYGASQGKNSLGPMCATIKELRARLGGEQPIMVVHIDQAANDFNTLFDVLHTDPERYSLNDPNVFPSANRKVVLRESVPEWLMLILDGAHMRPCG